MTCSELVTTYLCEQGAPYTLQHHRTTYTAHDTAATEHIADQQVAKVVVVVADDRPVMLVLPASLKVNLAHLGPLIGAQTVRLAHERELVRIFPDCEIGAMPPFGNLYGLPVYVDQALTANETIVCQAGTHTETIRLAYADFARLVQPVVVAFGRALPARFGPNESVAARERRRSDMFV